MEKMLENYERMVKSGIVGDRAAILLAAGIREDQEIRNRDALAISTAAIVELLAGIREVLRAELESTRLAIIDHGEKIGYLLKHSPVLRTNLQADPRIIQPLNVRSGGENLG